MKSESEVRRDLDAMCNILTPFNDDGREGMLATMIAWFLHHHDADRDVAITSLMARVAEIESGEREALQ
jgi:hypothetical protein